MIRAFRTVRPVQNSLRIQTPIRSIRPPVLISQRFYTNNNNNPGNNKNPKTSQSSGTNKDTKSSPFELDPKQQNSDKSKQKAFKWLIILGTLAFASSYLSKNFGQRQTEKNMPKESLQTIVENNDKKKKISVIFVLGGPGAGKGTQCANLVKDYNFVHLSAGDLLRAEQNREGSQYGQLIADYIKAGKIVPQEVTIGLLDREIQENAANGKTKFLIDGFPRKMDQAITFEEKVAVSDFTLFFQCPEEVMLKRLLNRGKTSGRADDNTESIKKRFRVFVETSMPVVEHFEQQGKVVKLQCDQSPEDVYETVKQAMKDRGII